MKRILKLLLILSLLMTSVNAEVLIDSENVTYSNSKTENTNVKSALDELIDKVDSVNQGGNATSFDIAEGKEAYVQGKLITGTKKNKPVYWKLEADNSVYLEGKEVTVSVDTSGGVDNLYVVYDKTNSYKIKTCSSTQRLTHYSVFQISSNVIGVYWGLEETVTDTTVDTSTQYGYTQQYYNYEYLTTYILSAGVLTKVTNVHVGLGNGDTSNYASFVSSYSNYNVNYSTDVVTSRDRVIYSYLEESPLAYYDRNVVYYNSYGYYSDTYSISNNEANCFNRYGYWFKPISVNIYTGAISAGTETAQTSTYYNSRDPAVYDTNYDYEISNYGITRLQYSDTTHTSFTKYLFYDYAGLTLVSSISGTTTDYGYEARQLANVYDGANLYAFNTTFKGGQTRTLSVTTSSSRFGSNTVTSPYFILNPQYKEYKQEFDLTDYLPPDVTLSITVNNKVKESITYLYYPLLKEIYVKVKTSDGGCVYLIFGIDDTTLFKDTGLSLSLESVSYRLNEDGDLISSRRVSSNITSNNNYSTGSLVLRYYR